jgi:hypothetical protein
MRAKRRQLSSSLQTRHFNENQTVARALRNAVAPVVDFAHIGITLRPRRVKKGCAIMVPRRLLLILLISAAITVSAGCHHGDTRQITPSTAQRGRVSVIAKPFVSGDQEMKDKFGGDLLSLGILAIKIDVENNTEDGLSLGRRAVSLAFPNGPQKPAVRIEARKAGPRGVAGVLAAIFDNSPDRKVRSHCAEWNNYGMPASLDIPPHATESRFAYFDFRDAEGKPLGVPPAVYQLSVTVSNDSADNSDTFRLSIDLSVLKPAHDHGGSSKTRTPAP